MLVLGLLFSSCSKDETDQLNDDQNQKATLSFGTLLNDMVSNRSQLKQAVSGIPDCSDEVPAYVEVALSQDGTWVVGDEANPVQVDLNPNPADYDGDGTENYFTEESAELELEPGTYSLEYFAVYDSMGNIIWVAPRDTDGSIFQNFVDMPLPFDINLGAGVKKYVDVDVVCYDDRIVNLYGYLFFDLETTEGIEFCIFGNYCDENGRHTLAEYEVSVWYGTDSNGVLLHENVGNTIVTNEDGDLSTEPVCIALPDRDGEDQYYVEISLVGGGLIRSGVITDADVQSLFDGEDNVDYYHFREGNCNMNDTPDIFNGGSECDPSDPTADCDSDGVPNDVDQCPNTPPGTEVNEEGCESIQVPGRDVVVFNDINIFKNTPMADPDNVTLVQNLVTFTTSGSRNDGNVVWLDRGRNARCSPVGNSECTDTNWEIMRSTIEGEGYTITDVYSTSGSLTDIPGDVKVIFLVMPTVDYTLAEINALKAFAAEGGRIIFIGEHDNYYLNINVENEFLVNMGAVLFNTGGALDCAGENGLELPAASIRVHPITEGIDRLTISCASVIEPGEDDYALFYDSTNSHVLAGVAKIDTTPLTELKPADNMKKAAAPREKLSNPGSASGF